MLEASEMNSRGRKGEVRISVLPHKSVTLNVLEAMTWVGETEKGPTQECKITNSRILLHRKTCLPTTYR
jgi:hypothetical protein